MKSQLYSFFSTSPKGKIFDLFHYICNKQREFKITKKVIFTGYEQNKT